MLILNYIITIYVIFIFPFNMGLLVYWIENRTNTK